MKKIVLISVLCALCAGSAFATQYKTASYNCNPNAMMRQLNDATAEHRAVITEIQCDAPASIADGGDYFEYEEEVKMEQVTTSEVFVRKAKREEPKPVEKRPVQEEPAVRYIETIVYTDGCDDDECCDCGCDDEPVEEVKPIVVPAKPVVPDNQGDLEEIEQCEKYGRCAS